MSGRQSARMSSSDPITRSSRSVIIWTFDEFYTAMALQGLDTDGDGKYSAEELKPLAEVNVNSLKEFDYFTYLHLAGDEDNLMQAEASGELLARL